MIKDINQKYIVDFIDGSTETILKRIEGTDNLDEEIRKNIKIINQKYRMIDNNYDKSKIKSQNHIRIVFNRRKIVEVKLAGNVPVLPRFPFTNQ